MGCGGPPRERARAVGKFQNLCQLNSGAARFHTKCVERAEARAERRAERARRAAEAKMEVDDDALSAMMDAFEAGWC